MVGGIKTINMKKLIKLSDIHYIIVDDSEIKQDDLTHCSYSGNINKCFGFEKKECCKKITHSTEKLVGVVKLNLSDVEEVLYGYNVDKMAENNAKKVGHYGGYQSYINGFKEHQELVKDKLFTLEQLFEFAEEYSNYIDKCTKSNVINPSSPEKYFENPFNLKNRKIAKQINLPKTEWDIEINEHNKITLL